MSKFLVMTVTSGSSATLGSVNGMGFPRLFEGDSLYVYRLSSSLQRSSDFGTTWAEAGNGATPRAICQDSSGTPTKTLIFTFSRLAVNSGFYQAVPESTSGWTATGALPSGFAGADAVTDLQGSIGVIVGNSHSGTESRIVKSALSAPYSFADSGAGLPQTSGSIALITDLEVQE